MNLEWKKRASHDSHTCCLAQELVYIMCKITQSPIYNNVTLYLQLAGIDLVYYDSVIMQCKQLFTGYRPNSQITL